MDKHNLGFFRIHKREIEKNPERIAEVFSMLKVVPVKAEYRPDYDAVEYLAISGSFEKIPEHSCAPEYELKITTSKAGNVELVEVEKI